MNIFTLHTPSGETETEYAYRRGYQQAWDKATEMWIDLLREGKSLTEIIPLMEDYIERLGAWRVDAPNDFNPPPPFLIAREDEQQEEEEEDE